MACIMTDSLLKAIDDYFGVLTKFTEVCPEDLWAEKFAGWPIWQYFWHALWINDRFLPGTPMVSPPGATDELALFQAKSDTPPSKAALAKLWAEQRPKTEAFVKSLTDTTMLQRNELVYNLLKIEWTNVFSAWKLHSHAFYHLGTFDAALRQRGLPGIY
ncbi:MAG: DinB family protein [Deltaproteobacteria bacterium]|nr:DinB family protein [Deltaproteobacteria bacterium]